MNIRSVSLKEYSSLRIGGEGRLVEVTSLAELIEVMMYAKKENMKVHVIGEGTNTFFGDAFPDMLFIKMNIKGISFQEEGSLVFLTAFAGENWDDLVKLAVEKKLWGIENLSYIPGTVGAAPIQNIGAYGTELKDTLVTLSALDRDTLNVVEITNEGCHFGYRESLFKQQKDKYIVISITLKLASVPHPVLTYKPLDVLIGKENVTLEEIRELVIATRKNKLPNYNEYPNNGSFFKNPIIPKDAGERLKARYPDIQLIDQHDAYKVPAAWLIEHMAQCKGVKEEDIGTWPNQPLVIVNYGNASAKDILDFSEKIITKIEAATGIRLEREVNFVG